MYASVGAATKEKTVRKHPLTGDRAFRGGCRTIVSKHASPCCSRSDWRRCGIKKVARRFRRQITRKEPDCVLHRERREVSIRQNDVVVIVELCLGAVADGDGDGDGDVHFLLGSTFRGGGNCGRVAV